MNGLHASVLDWPEAWGNRLAVACGAVALTYRELREGTLRVRNWLRQKGLGVGDRIGMCLPKSVDSVRVLLGVLAAGACVVPMDCQAPTGRTLKVVCEAQLQRLITFPRLAEQLASAATAGSLPPLTLLQDVATLDSGFMGADTGHVPDNAPAIMYFTSGSSGVPKGVMLSHHNIGSFVNWSVDAFSLSWQDRVTSHAPFHFDLSTFDLFAAFRVGACVHLLDETLVKFPPRVAQLLERQRITVWYSVPTALIDLLKLSALAGRDLSALRLVLFAGEAFPVPSLRDLMLEVPHANYVNLYGPTETNVCTYYRIPSPPLPSQLAIPIGTPCEHLQVTVRQESGELVDPDEVGEICVSGPAVMLGYWSGPGGLQTQGDTYHTGDFGYWGTDGNIHLIGRRDHQVKIRGHRMELGEIESVLVSHPSIQEAAVLWNTRHGDNGELVAYVTVREGKQPLSITELRSHCGTMLAPYALPEQVTWLDELPRTSTGKIDRQGLMQL